MDVFLEVSSHDIISNSWQLQDSAGRLATPGFGLLSCHLLMQARTILPHFRPLRAGAVEITAGPHGP